MNRLDTMIDSSVLVIEECCACHIRFAMPQDLQQRALADRGISFYCPSGHSQHYSGETEAEKLKRQLSYAQTRATRWEDNYRAAERSKAALKGHLTRARNKIAAGNCPVPDCGQHFANVREHMKFKHPDFHLTDPETGEKAEL